jgi:hypothetical protein
VTFFAERGQVVSATIAKDGTFLTPEIPAGRVRVAVTTPPPRPNVAVERPPGPVTQAPPGGAPERFQQPTVEIPKRYADPETSGLTLTVERDARHQVFNIDLIDNK